jgi:hypothetical protein
MIFAGGSGGIVSPRCGRQLTAKRSAAPGLCRLIAVDMANACFSATLGQVCDAVHAMDQCRRVRS